MPSGSESPRTWTGSGGMEPVHDAGIESAEITALTPYQAAKLPAGPVKDDLRRGVPAAPGSMTDLVQHRAGMAAGHRGSARAPACDLEGQRPPGRWPGGSREVPMTAQVASQAAARVSRPAGSGGAPILAAKITAPGVPDWAGRGRGSPG